MEEYTGGLAPCKPPDHVTSSIQQPAPNPATANTAAELNTDSDPRNEIENKKNNSVEPKKRGRGRPKTHGLSKDPAYTSYREAKRRCTDPNHPDFERYGGRGIEFRLNSPAEIVVAIGARPAGATLDRIDANGHYEIGNIRWATAKQQANNRNAAGYYQQQARERRWHQSRDARATYQEAMRHWKVSVKCVRGQKLTQEDVEFLNDVYAQTAIPRPFWENADDSNPGYFTLPSLNNPGSTVTVRGGPFPSIVIPGVEDRGYIEGMGGFHLSLNCTPEERAGLNSFVNNFRRSHGPSGLVFSGCTMCYNSNRIEGRLLAIAARLAFLGRKTRFVLAGEIAADLAIEDTDKLLEDEYLVIPDLDMWSAAFGSEPLLTYRLAEVLRERERYRLPTIVYAEDGPELDTRIASILTHRYRRIDLSKIPPICHVVPGQ
jgi:hypothetical protein